MPRARSTRVDTATSGLAGTIAKGDSTPDWVIIACALAISLGTYMGGWRIIRTLGKGLIEIESPQGFAAEATSAAVILSSTHFGIPLSTTQVCSGSVVGAGVGRAQPVRWKVFGRMVVTWVVTLPAAAGVGALTYWVVDSIGGDAGVVIMSIALAAYCLGIYLLSRKSAVNATNVNDAWDDKAGVSHEPELVGASN